MGGHHPPVSPLDYITDCTICSTVVATAVAAEEHPLFERDVKEAVASSNFIILFNVNDVIGPLPSHIPFMKRYAHNTEMALSKFL